MNVFWVTFINQAKPPDAPAPDSTNAQPVSSLDMNNLVDAVAGFVAQPQVKVQLHWVEYFQGKWSKRVSTDINRQQPIFVPQNFNANNVLIHVSKEVDSNGNEGAVLIHLDFAYPDDGVTFRVTSKNCDPDFNEQYWQPGPQMVYDAPYVDATLYTGSGNLTSSFQTGLSGSTSTSDTENILDTANDFALLACANPVAPPFLPRVIRNTGRPELWSAPSFSRTRVIPTPPSSPRSSMI